MIEAQHARDIAQAALREVEADLGTPPALWDGQFDWNSVEYLETGDFRRRAGGRSRRERHVATVRPVTHGAKARQHLPGLRLP
jgi:hypothetical protein